MYNIIMERQCGCFRKSGYEEQRTFDSKDDALIEAMEMVNEFNETFCQKHSFVVREEGDNFIVAMQM